MALAIPRYIIEYFLTGRTRPDAIERFTQNGGIVSDVWFEFAKNLDAPVRVLISPSEGVSGVDVGAVLHDCITEYRGTPEAQAIWHGRDKPGVSPLDNFVAVTLYFDGLLRVVLPLTQWWSERRLGRLNQAYNKGGGELQLMLAAEIKRRLGHEDGEPRTTAAGRTRRGEVGSLPPANGNQTLQRRIREAAPIAALIGLFLLVQRHPDIVANIPDEQLSKEAFVELVRRYADAIATTAVEELAREIPERVFHPHLTAPSEQAAKFHDPDRTDPPALIERVFLDRRIGLAVANGICTIKADAAARLFETSCRNLTWGIIDAGIDSRHPAFEDHDAQPSDENPEPTRVRTTLDFTLIERIRSFDLTEGEPNSPEQLQVIRKLIEDLKRLPDYPDYPPRTRRLSLEEAAEQFQEMAEANLALIAVQLKLRLQPDWSLIEPLIQRRRLPRPGEPEPRRTLASHHGTHVAGILAADWRSARPGQDEEGEDEGVGQARSKRTAKKRVVRERARQAEKKGAVQTPEAPERKLIMRGVCPDINLFDLRVIDPHADAKNTEFAVLAALEYVQFANRRTAGMKQVIHGVNVSLSIPHEVRSYACGSTPVCVACNNLVGAGVVVVAAAGNRGWNEQEMGFGTFVFCSITDPGNAADVITVGATHRQKPHTYGVSFFSSRGPTGDGRIKPDLVAPGEKIKGPVLDNSDDELDGTSMAAPFVSGAAALLIARNGELLGNPRRIKQILCESATDLGREKYFQGHGLVDVLRALQSV
jgi:serine protease AprX